MVSLGEKAEWWSSGLGSEHSWIMQQTTVFIKLPNQVTRKTQVQWGSAKVDILTCYPLKSYFCSCSAPCSSSACYWESWSQSQFYYTVIVHWIWEKFIWSQAHHLVDRHIKHWNYGLLSFDISMKINIQCRLSFSNCGNGLSGISCLGYDFQDRTNITVLCIEMLDEWDCVAVTLDQCEV